MTLIFGQRQFDNFSNGFIFAQAYLQSRRAARIFRGGSGAKMDFLGVIMISAAHGRLGKSRRSLFLRIKIIF